LTIWEQDEISIFHLFLSRSACIACRAQFTVYPSVPPSVRPPAGIVSKRMLDDLLGASF